MGHSRTHCKDGLRPKQEVEARRLKKLLLDEEKRNMCIAILVEIYDSLSNYGNIEVTDEQYIEELKLQNPSLYSACLRVELDIKEEISKYYIV